MLSSIERSWPFSKTGSKERTSRGLQIINNNEDNASGEGGGGSSDPVEVGSLG